MNASVIVRVMPVKNPAAEMSRDGGENVTLGLKAFEVSQLFNTCIILNFIAYYFVYSIHITEFLLMIHHALNRGYVPVENNVQGYARR